MGVPPIAGWSLLGKIRKPRKLKWDDDWEDPHDYGNQLDFWLEEHSQQVSVVGAQTIFEEVKWSPNLSSSQTPINTLIFVGGIDPDAVFCWWHANLLAVSEFFRTISVAEKSPALLVKAWFWWVNSPKFFPTMQSPNRTFCQEKPVSTMLYFGWAGPSHARLRGEHPLTPAVWYFSRGFGNIVG